MQLDLLPHVFQKNIHCIFIVSFDVIKVVYKKDFFQLIIYMQNAPVMDKRYVIEIKGNFPGSKFFF